MQSTAEFVILAGVIEKISTEPYGVAEGVIYSAIVRLGNGNIIEFQNNETYDEKGMYSPYSGQPEFVVGQEVKVIRFGSGLTDNAFVL